MFSLLKDKIVFWFRRDLRLEDNIGLFHALSENEDVLPVFIFDKKILDKLEDKKDSRVEFIHHSLSKIDEKLKQAGSSLLVLHGDPVEIYKEYTPRKLYFNHDYEPYATQRDNTVINIIQENNGAVKHYKDHLIYEKSDIVKDDGKPYSVFTPYSRKWKSNFNSDTFQWHYPSEDLIKNFHKNKNFELPTLKSLGFEKTGMDFPSSEIDNSILKKYQEKRDIPSIQGTSRLSVHFRFGTISIRKALKAAINTSETWLNELIWREFYAMILWNFPHVAKGSFRPQYDQIPWINDEEQFQAWCEGKTGYPIVDAGMRELNATGFMHNRVRMITASFLVKHLLIDWRWGEAYFAKKLMDFELASNNGGWQWASGSGCDAAPYFRVFNPELQTKKFDPELKYIKKWVPEFQDFSYPKPIVEHSFARKRAIETYKKALS